MQITEIYLSVQGESSYAGWPCIFIRTTGCNLRCVWCDTAYAFHGGEAMSVDEVITAVAGYRIKLVEITGGEPLLQKDMPELAQRLVANGYTVLVETSGERDISVLGPDVIRIMDLKCPGSGESERNRWGNIAHLNHKDEVKFVLRHREDYEWAKARLLQHQIDQRAQVLFSPVHGELVPRELAEWILSDGLKVRFQLQLHKYVWPHDVRGV